jgi:hypothetical protein
LRSVKKGLMVNEKEEYGINMPRSVSEELRSELAFRTSFEWFGTFREAMQLIVAIYRKR